MAIGNNGMPYSQPISRAFRAGLIICAAFLVNACNKPQKAAIVPPALPAPVRVAAAARMDVPRIAETVGTAKPSVTVQVRARVDGLIKKVHFKEGAEVREGQLLFEVDSEPFDAALKEAEATLEASRSQVKLTRIEKDRAEKLAKAGAAPIEVFEKARASHESAMAAEARDSAKRDVARLQLGYCKVMAPIDGIAGKLETDGGSLTRGYDPRPVIGINKSRPVYVEFALPERLLPMVRPKPGKAEPLEVEVRKNQADKALRGAIEFLDNQVDTSTGTITLRARFSNKELEIWPGEFFEVRVILGTDKGVMTIPVTALGQGSDGPHVFVIDQQDTARMRRIKVKRVDRDLVLVDDGLAEGELVVIEGSVRLQDGIAVRRIPEAVKK